MAPEPVVAVVNHDPIFVRLMERVLRGAGYTPLACPSGTAAHDVILKAQPDVIIVDTWLETRESGWQLLQTLVLDDQTHNIPIVLCSSDNEEVAKRIQELHKISHLFILPKPFDPDALINKVRQAIAEGGSPLGPK